MLVDGLNKISNKGYHEDKKYLSSSSLKLLLKDIGAFHDRHILGNYVNETKVVFDEGSYVHALILEPEVIPQEFAFYPGMRKQGREFREFKERNFHKTIISTPQKMRCAEYVRAFNRLKEATDIISGGESEHTICGEIAGVPVKVRCDYINVEKGYIADIKTSSYPVDLDSFRMTMNQFAYDLSAALYCMVAEQHYGKKFDFYFVPISKRENVCEVFKTSPNTQFRGRHAVMEALRIYKECKETNDWTSKHDRDTVVVSDYEVLEI